MDGQTLSVRSKARSRKVGGATDVVLLATAIVLLAWSLLVLLPATTTWLWFCAILIGEWGHFAAVVGLVLALLGLRRGGTLGRVTTTTALAAAVLCALPVARAALIARTLPARCTGVFGAAQKDLRSPLSLIDLVCGVRSGRVDVTEHVYATNGAKQLKLDLYRDPRATAPQPLVVMLHGGSWNGGTKKQLAAVNSVLAGEGYAVASINYRHAPAWKFPAAVDDVFRAIDYLRNRAAEFQIDPSRIVLIGRSAGGQLALSAGYARRDPGIRGVVALYAPTDLVMGYEHRSAPGILDSRKVLEDYLGGSPAEIRANYTAASPSNFVDSATPPTLLIHGALDRIVWPAHSEKLAGQLQNAGRPNLYLSLPWATHGCDANVSGPSGQLSLYVINRFLASLLGKP